MRRGEKEAKVPLDVQLSSKSEAAHSGAKSVHFREMTSVALSRRRGLSGADLSIKTGEVSALLKIAENSPKWKETPRVFATCWPLLVDLTLPC